MGAGIRSTLSIICALTRGLDVSERALTFRSWCKERQVNAKTQGVSECALILTSLQIGLAGFGRAKELKLC